MMLCRVFIDGSYHGEMKASTAADVNGYQYSVEDLNPGQTYDVAVKVRTHCCCHKSQDVSVSVCNELRAVGIDCWGITTQ